MVTLDAPGFTIPLLRHPVRQGPKTISVCSGIASAWCWRRSMSGLAVAFELNPDAVAEPKRRRRSASICRRSSRCGVTSRSWWTRLSWLTACCAQPVARNGI